MSRAPALERDQAPEEVRALYDMVEKRPGVPVEQLDGLSDPVTNPAYREVERLVIRYAEQLNTTGRVDDAVHAALAAQLPTRQLVELALTVAAAQFSNRVNAALELDLEHP
jgi:alkylhydroperoxidase family enzyme